MEIEAGGELMFLNPSAIASISAPKPEVNADPKSPSTVTLVTGARIVVQVRVDILRDRWAECFA